MGKRYVTFKLTTKYGKKVHYAFAILLIIGFVLGFVAAYWY